MSSEKIGGEDIEMNRGKMIWNPNSGKFEEADKSDDPERDAYEFKKKVEEGKERAEAEKKAKADFEKRVKFYQEHPEQIVQLTGDDSEKAEWYRNNPDKIDQLLQEVDAKAEAYKEEHPEVVPEIGHQTTEAVDQEALDRAWEDYGEGKVDYDKKMTENEKLLINDPQTSGGLLMFMGEEEKNKMVKLCKEKDMECFEIGKIYEKKEKFDSK